MILHLSESMWKVAVEVVSESPLIVTTCVQAGVELGADGVAVEALLSPEVD
jgi:hypothetical protein